MNADARPRFARGVKLRRETSGESMLLVPEGALVLNAGAAAALDLVDGERTLSEIVDAIVERFEVTRETAKADVASLFERLSERGFMRFSTPLGMTGGCAEGDAR